MMQLVAGSHRLGRAFFRTTAMVVTLSLAACGRPIGVMQPVSENVPGTSKIDLLVATTRLPDQDPAILFSGERGPGLKVDAVSVSIPPEANRKVGLRLDTEDGANGVRPDLADRCHARSCSGSAQARRAPVPSATG